MDSHSDSSLLRLVYSQLYPDVFSHPVWIYFGDAGTSESIELIRTLMHTCDQLQTHEDQSTVCQLLLLCAVLQLRSGDHDAAITTLRKAIELGERNGVSAIDCWASWGMSAVYIQLGKWREAAKQLIHLKTQFTERGEWVLANIMELICEYLLRNSLSSPDEPLSLPTESFLKEALSWLKNWGTPPKLIDVPHKYSTGQSDKDVRLPDSSRPMISISCRIRNLLSTIKRLALGELRLKLVETGGLENYLQSIPTTRIAPQQREANVPSLAQTGLNVVDEPVDPTPSLGNASQQVDTFFIPVSTSTSKQPPLDVQDKTGIALPRSEKTTVPTLSACMLGEFRLFVENVLVEQLHEGLSSVLLKYILHNHKRRIPRDELMDVFWPDVEPDSARNRLNVTLNKIRKALRHNAELEIILFDTDRYFLNPDLHIWIDADHFENLLSEAKRLDSSGETDLAVRSLEQAAKLYRGDFLEGDIYEEWTILTRERLRLAYLDVLYQLSQTYFRREDYSASADLCQLILNRDSCREDAHRRLMRCYSRLGQRPLALRQYQLCAEALKNELDIDPEPATLQLVDRIRRQETV